MKVVIIFVLVIALIHTVLVQFIFCLILIQDVLCVIRDFLCVIRDVDIVYCVIKVVMIMLR